MQQVRLRPPALIESCRPIANGRILDNDTFYASTWSSQLSQSQGRIPFDNQDTTAER